MAGIDIPSIVAGLGELSRVQAQQTQQIAQTRFSQGEVGEQIAENMFEVGRLQEAVETQKLEAALRAQNNSRSAARAMGMDMTASNEIISHMGRGMRTDILAHDLASRRSQAIEEQGNLLANPLGWLEAVLNGPEAAATAAATKERVATQQQQMNNMHSLTQANVQTQNAIAETMTASSIKDAARANALIAESKALEAVNQAKEYTVAGIDTLREYGSVEFNRRLQVGNVVRQQQQHEQSMAMRKAELAQRQKSLEMELEAKEVNQQYADMINAYQERVGSKAAPVTAGAVERYLGTNTPQGQRYAMMLDRAFLAEDTGSNVIGRDPFDSYNAVRTLGLNMPANADPNTVTAFETAERTLAEELAEARAFTTDMQSTERGLTKENMDSMEARGRIFNSVVNETLKQQDSTFDQFKLNTDAIASEDPALAQTEYYTTVVEPLAGTDAGITIQDAAAQTAEKFVSGEVDINTATEGLRRLWQDQLDLFNATNGRMEMGLPTYVNEVQPRLLVGENITRTRGGAVVSDATIAKFGRASDFKSGEIYEHVDLTDPNAITRWLIKFKSNRVAREMSNSANSGGTGATGRY